MPSKGHRAASKQAKLRQKHRRGKGGPRQFDTGPTESEAVAMEFASDSEIEVNDEQKPDLAVKHVASVSNRTQLTRSVKQSTTADLTASRYLYLGAELRRIAIITAIIILILVAMSFVLGD